MFVFYKNDLKTFCKRTLVHMHLVFGKQNSLFNVITNKIKITCSLICFNARCCQWLIIKKHERAQNIANISA